MNELVEHCVAIAPIFKIPETVEDYDFLVEVLDELLDAVGSDDNHPLQNIIDIISDRISVFDEIHFTLGLSND